MLYVLPNISPPRTGARVLVCAENPVKALRIETTLREAGYAHVRVTSDVREVEPLFAKWAFSLLILDMHATSQSPFILIERLRPHMERRTLAIVGLTAQGDTLMQDRVLRAGIASVMSHDIDRDEILMHVNYALDQVDRGHREQMQARG